MITITATLDGEERTWTADTIEKAQEIPHSVAVYLRHILSDMRFKQMQAALDNTEVRPHEYLADYSGMSCGAMVERDGGGDQCGLDYAHPLHVKKEVSA